MAEDLGAVLRREAGRHVPDGDAMFDRINRRRFAPGPVTAPRPVPLFTGLRPVAAAVSVVATLVAGFTGIRILSREEPERAPAATTTATPAATTTVTPAASMPATSAPPPARSSPEPGHTGGGTGSSPRSAPASASPSFQPVSGFLRSRGAINAHSARTWAQSDVTITTTEEITALDLAISVARTDGVRSTGSWSTVPGEMITLTVTARKDVLIYRFTLEPGGRLAAGDYTFAGQYEHADGKRDAGADRYGAICWAGDRKAEVTGTFAGS
ncbi:hypothetical protein Acy02nite_23100 [Actinoplanes cyaneus]|uniref:Uncharacterized protein n=1 Tax=Actinoplanes cyaneus TaxID=52696 RepID=A0A919M6I2_9ACTN|nr:hypothetical protein [Actinoplanes cyaneus]MCW2136425.1 hypothetical protein [Actinoplanes cyaneus]GID64429.1 hypothetical protein Acy02nite_23100 [Actinoplanes cyaneus]